MLQFLGYSVALGGLVWYKLGAEKVKEHYENLADACRQKKKGALAFVGSVGFLMVVFLYYAFLGEDKTGYAMD
jgi:hypothetical protein